MKLSSTLSCLIIGLIPIISSATIVLPAENNGWIPTGKGWSVKSNNPPATVKDKSIPQNGINYHGGPVMGTTSSTIPNAYYIWYGNWTGNSAKNILTNLMLGMGVSRYYNINSTYQDASGRSVQRQVNFPHYGVNDNYSQGTALTDNSVELIVRNAISTNQLPLDSNGIYFVLTSKDVQETSGFCTAYCGWHTYTTINNTAVKYSFVGDSSTQCPSGCGARTPSPNDNAGADGMASVIAHELEETVTDPNLDAWWDDVSGGENADKCAWNFGATQTAPNGSQYNVTISKMHYLIQQNWLNANGGLCAIAL